MRFAQLVAAAILFHDLLFRYLFVCIIPSCQCQNAEKESRKKRSHGCELAFGCAMKNCARMATLFLGFILVCCTNAVIQKQTPSPTPFKSQKTVSDIDANGDLFCGDAQDCIVDCTPTVAEGNVWGGVYDSDDCSNTNIYCPDNHDCTVKCANSPCEHATIFAQNSSSLTVEQSGFATNTMNDSHIECPVNGSCTVNCNGANYGCKYMMLDASFSTELTLNCERSTTGNQKMSFNCKYISVLCPEESSHSCTIVTDRYYGMFHIEN